MEMCSSSENTDTEFTKILTTFKSIFTDLPHVSILYQYVNALVYTDMNAVCISVTVSIRQ
jgi:hypothetical protein